MKRVSLDAYLSHVIRTPVWALLACTAITLFLSWPLPRLSFKTTVYDLVIENVDETERYCQFLSRFGSDEIIRLVVKAEDVLEPATFAKITRLSDAASQIDGVIRTISLPEIKRSVDRGTPWNMDQFAAMLAPVDLFKRNLISADRRTTIITLVLAAQTNKNAVIAAVRRLIAATGKDLQLYQTGMPLVSEALATYTRQDFFHLTPITMLVIATLLTILLRHLRSLMLPLACVTLSVWWTFGLMALFDIPVSMLTIIIPVFLIAVGTAYCLHIATEYLRQLAIASSAKEATLATFQQLTFPVSLAVATTLIGLGSLWVNPITAIREFAMFACFGMFSLLIVMLSFFPAMLSLLPATSAPPAAAPALDRFFDRVLSGVVALNLKHRKRCLVIIGMVALVCAAGMLRLRVETNPVAYFKTGADVRRHFHAIYADMSGSFPMNVVMAGGEADYFETPGNVAAIADLQAYLDSLPGVDKTISLADYLKLVNYTVNNFDPEFYRLPEDRYDLRMLINNFKILLGNDFLQRFMSADYSRVNILMLTHIASSRDFLSIRDRILTHVNGTSDDDVRVDVTGLGVVIAASSRLITLGQVKSLSLSLVLIFAVMVVLFLSSKVGLIAVVPNLFPILVNFGLMGLLGIPLSVATSLIASVAIGLAVDDTIHYLVRYNTEFRKDLNKDRAMRDTLLAVGRPIIFSSLTISLGFCVLGFSHFQPTAIFGFLMVVTMLSALIGDLILLPSLMLHVELVTAWDLLKLMPTMGGISPAMLHELNQPLNAIKVGSDFLKMMARKDIPPAPAHLAEVAGEIGNQVARASRMIQRLGEMGQTPGFAKQPLSIGKPITDTLAVVENQLHLENISLTINIDPDLPPIMGHHGRFVQVIYNLLDNAQEAIIQQREKNDTPRPHAITINAASAAGSVVVTVTDTGIGIPDHIQDRIFEPFFTTKESEAGKGLGLSIVHEIVRDLGGRLLVTSNPDLGTTITLSFPAVAAWD